MSSSDVSPSSHGHARKMGGKAWLLLMTLGVLWGIPYFFIRIAVTDYHPIVVAFARSVIGALLLLPFAINRQRLARGFGKPQWLLAFTLCEISAPWFLIGYAEQHVTSSLAGLVIAATPIMATVLGVAFSQERLSKQRACGLVLGFGGVAALLGFDGQSVQILPVLALCISALGYALGPIIVDKKLANADSTVVLMASLVVASLTYIPFVPGHWPVHFSLSATASVVALALFCTVLAFQLLFALVSEVGPARATVVTYINPAVAAFLGIALLSEPFSWGIVFGLALIVTGSYLATKTPVQQ